MGATERELATKAGPARHAKATLAAAWRRRSLVPGAAAQAGAGTDRNRHDGGLSTPHRAATTAPDPWAPGPESYYAMFSSIQLQAKQTLAKLYKEEDGGELLEYALIAGLIVVAAIGAVKAFGSTMKGKINDMEAVVSTESFNTTTK